MPHTIRIAYAEDHKILLQTLSSMLNDEEDIDVVIQATDGKALLEQLKSTEVDIVMLDLDMPGIDGRRTLQLIKQFYPSIKVIILSFHDSEVYIRKFMSEGAAGYLSKEDDYDVIREAIRVVHLTGIYLHGFVSSKLIDELTNNTKVFPKIMEGDPLSKREIEIVNLVCQGKSNCEIASTLHISQRTVENHRARVKSKTGSKSIAETIVYAIKAGIFEVEI